MLLQLRTFECSEHLMSVTSFTLRHCQNILVVKHTKQVQSQTLICHMWLALACKARTINKVVNTHLQERKEHRDLLELLVVVHQVSGQWLQLIDSLHGKVIWKKNIIVIMSTAKTWGHVYIVRAFASKDVHQCEELQKLEKNTIRPCRFVRKWSFLSEWWLWNF